MSGYSSPGSPYRGPHSSPRGSGQVFCSSLKDQDRGVFNVQNKQPWTGHLFVHTAAEQTRDGRANYGFRSSCFSSGHFPLRLRLPCVIRWESSRQSPIHKPISLPLLPFLMCHGEARRRKERESYCLCCERVPKSVANPNNFRLLLVSVRPLSTEAGRHT